ncbi:MAG TPA: hypothetical protein VGC42_19980 [Kofleriaceae bacterium]
MHAGMSSRGKQLAFLFAVVMVFFLPKRIECSRPGATCGHAGLGRSVCVDYDTEPFGFYLLELALDRDVGFAYAHDAECR